ncbi:hypothetical protein [Mastigocladopsis repens]|uniref:hypothetical protein n=1 Tax=Mastigocladopsis repens TaxID=221287 RepID=UPI001E38421D|nr:hypothetical protein [Mastigocladopsis repens]
MTQGSEFRNILMFAKVEKYINIGNKWISQTSEKVLEEVHKTAEVIGKFESEKKYLSSSTSQVQKYVNIAKKWLLETPERALDEAYKAALVLNKIEDEYFAGSEITSVSNSSDSVATYFDLKTQKYRLTIEIRMMEFRASYSIIDTSNVSPHTLGESSMTLEKLKFINEVLTRHSTKQTNMSIPAESSALVGEQIAGVFEQEISNQLGSKWQLLESFYLPIEQEENSLDSQAPTTRDIQPQTQLYTPLTGDPQLHTAFAEENTLEPQAPTIRDIQPQTQTPSTGGRAQKIGLASIVFAAGFAGGACSWALFSSQDAVANNNIHHNLTQQVNSNRIQKTISTDAISSPCVPEIISSESGFSR